MQKRALRTACLSVLCVASGTVFSLSALAGDEGHSSNHAMKMMDSDNDGKVTSAEHAAGAKKMFQHMDADSDGRVTATEMDAHHSTMMGKHGTQEGKHKTMSSAEKIRKIDQNDDGVLTAQEHADGSQKMFTKMDGDKDGTLTATEIKSGHRKMMSAQDHE